MTSAAIPSELVGQPLSQWQRILLYLAAGAILGLALWVWLMTVVVAWWVQCRIPGLTGDVYGAINELTEVGALLFLLAVEGLRAIAA